jgi:aspartyl-tRNA(Asn)/glutamyl-tRNA(Gln) amidotransferase subunit B
MKDLPYDLWEPVIGLEIHVQLNTKSKLFSSAPNRFGDEPNTNITDVCTGQPGSLPVLNKEVVFKAVQFGLAINAKVEPVSSFDRKSYFYPDSPRNFQITQFRNPIIRGGEIIVDIEGKTKKIEIEHAHLEDDAGMLKHFASFAGIDYNRAGVPLIEIVSKPVIHSAKEASSYAMAIKAIMQYINASECNMEQGHLRFDANISVRPKGDKKLRTKVEIKNMNSFNFLEMAIEAEITRQIYIYTTNQEEELSKLITPSTYRFDPQTKQNILMRSKESAEDYRYFPEPDLPPIVLTSDYINKAKELLPELPLERFNRYLKDFNLSEYSASQLINEKLLSDYFEEALKYSKNAHAICNWMTIEFAGRLKEKGETLISLGIPPLHIAKLVNFIDNNTITGKIAKSVADDMILSPEKDPEKIVKENPNYQPITDSFSIEPIVDKVIKDNPESIQDYKQGKTKAFAFLVGQVMKETKGKASPSLVNDLLKKKIED